MISPDWLVINTKLAVVVEGVAFVNIRILGQLGIPKQVSVWNSGCLEFALCRSGTHKEDLGKHFRWDIIYEFIIPSDCRASDEYNGTSVTYTDEQYTVIIHPIVFWMQDI